MTATRAPPSTGIRARSRTRSRTPRSSRPPIGIIQPGAGRRQPMHVRMVAVLERAAAAAGPARPRTRSSFRHNRPAATSSANVVLPTPAGPVTSTPWGIPPRSIASAATTAAGWPRVRNPGVGSGGGLGLAPRRPALRGCGFGRSSGSAAAESTDAGSSAAAVAVGRVRLVVVRVVDAALRVPRVLGAAAAPASGATSSVDALRVRLRVAFGAGVASAVASAAPLSPSGAVRRVRPRRAGAASSTASTAGPASAPAPIRADSVRGSVGAGRRGSARP